MDNLFWIGFVGAALALRAKDEKLCLKATVELVCLPAEVQSYEVL